MSSIYDWSVVAANNSNSDVLITWAEGQAPSTVNNSARQLEARVREFITDIGGSIAAGGTANGLTITMASAFTALADGQIVAFRATASNSGAATLNVNSIGAKAIRKMDETGDVALVANEIRNTGIYVARYSAALNGAAGAWLLINPTTVGTFTSIQRWGKGADIASAGALTIPTDGNYFHVTGTTTITSLSTHAAGTRILLEFDGALILTHNATSLILPGGVNRTTAPGDVVEFVSEGAGNWRMSDNSPVSCMITSTALLGGTFPITIPTGAKRIVIALEDVQFNAGSTFGLKLGDSGGIESTNYFGSMSTLIATTSTALFSTQFNISPAAAPGFLVAGIIELALAHINVAAPTWSYKSGMARTDVASTYFGAGQKTLTTELTSLELNSGATVFAGGRATVHVYF